MIQKTTAKSSQSKKASQSRSDKTHVKTVSNKRATASKSAKKVAKKATKKTASKATKSAVKKPATKSTTKATNGRTKKQTTASTNTRQPAAAAPTQSQMQASAPIAPMPRAGAEAVFCLVNGQLLDDLLALNRALNNMDEATYQYHVSGSQNDFALWVEQVLQDQLGATELRKAHTPHVAHQLLARHIRYYYI